MMRTCRDAVLFFNFFLFQAHFYIIINITSRVLLCILYITYWEVNFSLSHKYIKDYTF